MAGAIIAALDVTEFGEVLAAVLVGLGLIAMTGLVFLEVGLSEDRQRERERRRAERERERAERLKHPERPRRPPLGRLGPRRRGH